MSRRLAGVALALVIVGGASQLMAKPPIHAPTPSGGVTTLEPSGGEGWRPSDAPGDPFTPVGVIGGRNVNGDVDSDGALGIAPSDPAIETQAIQRAKPGEPPKAGANWLPEPPTWALLLVGVAMIGFAIRALVAARSRLTRLEETDP